ncbi:MAG: serine/threonine-protein phosphatase [Deltaproteobacteria bacterium]|nr:MAG: serine/threonine-protein phosphatase [Deltaproteobacteria bacterium]
MPIAIGYRCSIGGPVSGGGRERNEDNLLVCSGGRARWREGEVIAERPANGEGVLLAVCDGMGGHQDGDAAARKAARVMAELYRPGRPRDPARALRRYLLDAHSRLHYRAREKGKVTMGTTLTAAWLLHNKLHWAHVGDSRLYLFRKGQLTQLTDDHTRNLFRKRDGRELLPGPEGNALAQAFLYGSRGFGDNAGLRIEHGRDTGTAELIEGDTVVLASDGAYRILGDGDLADLLAEGLSPQDTADEMIERAILHGTTDNATAVVAYVESLDEVETDSDAWGLEEDTLMI